MSAPLDRALVPPALQDAGLLEALAREHGTPLFVYDEDDLRRRCREYVAQFGEGSVAYAGKAFLCTAMARLVAEEGLHLDVATGGELHVALRAGVARSAAVQVARSQSLAFAGLHCHIGSQIYVLESYRLAMEIVASLAAEIEAESGAGLGDLNLGGGLGVRYLLDDPDHTVAEYARVLRNACDAAVAAAGLRSAPRLMVEPCRSIAAPAAITLYRIGTVKTIPQGRTYVADDGSMSDNPRPVLYGAGYEAYLTARIDEP